MPALLLLQHMNHGPGFQKLMGELKSEVREMQARGYYGDGESFSTL